MMTHTIWPMALCLKWTRDFGAVTTRRMKATGSSKSPSRMTHCNQQKYLPKAHFAVASIYNYNSFTIKLNGLTVYQVGERLREKETDHHGSESNPRTNSAPGMQHTHWEDRMRRTLWCSVHRSSIAFTITPTEISRKSWRTARNQKQLPGVEARGMVQEEQSARWFSNLSCPRPVNSCTEQPDLTKWIESMASFSIRAMFFFKLQNYYVVQVANTPTSAAPWPIQLMKLL